MLLISAYMFYKSNFNFRFQYNQEKRMAEKVNSFLDFPEVIYMDRYVNTSNHNAYRIKTVRTDSYILQE